MIGINEACQQACTEIGIVYRDVPQDGAWHRTDVEGKLARNDDASIKLFSDGEGGIVHNWTNGEQRVFFADDGRTLSPHEREERNRKREELQRKAAREIAAAQEAAAQKAVKLWQTAKPVQPGHPYLNRKQVDPVTTLREITIEEVTTIAGYHPHSAGEPLVGRILIAPVKIGDKISTVEMIDEAGRKAALAKGVKKGGYWAAQPLPDTEGEGITLLIGEGIATVLSGKLATNYYAVAALCCSNLSAVANLMRRRYSKAKVIILADIGNGQTDAEHAARAIGGIMAVPTFKDTTGHATDFNDLYLAEGHDRVREIIEIAKEPEAAENEDSEGSEEKSVETKCFPVRPFPFEVLPEPFNSLVKEYSTALQVQPEIMAMCMLTVSSGTVGNSLALQIKRGWKTPPFLWLAVINDTGTGKTHAIDAVMQPVKERQGKVATRYKSLMDEHNKRLAAYRADKKNCTLPTEPPPMKHYYSQNFTIESLIPMYQADARGLIIHVDELAGLFKGLNQYKASGNDREQLLSLFDAGDLKSDRKGGCGYVRNSGAAVIGGIQRGILYQVFGDSDYVNGMVYRILPMIVEPFPPRFTLDCISETATETWQRFVEWTYEIPLEIDPQSGRILPNKLKLEPAALEAWRLFHDRYAGSEPFVSPKFRGFLPKLRTYCLKFMIELHVMECYHHDTLALTVSTNTVNGAIKLTEYFAGQALQLITGAVDDRNPYHALLHKALNSLRGEVAGGKLLINRIREQVNELLPGDVRLNVSDNRQVSSWLRDLGFTVTTGTGNKAVLIWDPDKIFS